MFNRFRSDFKLLFFIYLLKNIHRNPIIFSKQFKNFQNFQCFNRKNVNTRQSILKNFIFLKLIFIDLQSFKKGLSRAETIFNQHSGKDINTLNSKKLIEITTLEHLSSRFLIEKKFANKESKTILDSELTQEAYLIKLTQHLEDSDKTNEILKAFLSIQIKENEKLKMKNMKEYLNSNLYLDEQIKTQDKKKKLGIQYVTSMTKMIPDDSPCSIQSSKEWSNLKQKWSNNEEKINILSKDFKIELRNTNLRNNLEFNKSIKCEKNLTKIETKLINISSLPVSIQKIEIKSSESYLN